MKIATFMVFLLLSLCFQQGVEFFRLSDSPFTYLTAHFTHLSYTHLVMNTCAFALFLFVCNAKKMFEIIILILFAAIFISFGIKIFTSYSWYVGFSGVLHALFFYDFLKQRHLFIGKAGIALMISKAIFENIFVSESYAEFLGGNVCTESHILGIVAAFVWVIGSELLKRVRVKSLSNSQMSAYP